MGEKFCHSLQAVIENDDIIENTEKIQIQISDPPSTLTARSSVEVLIEDADGMLLPI